VTASQQASETIVDSLESKRQSISGVSLDEEAADLARWQQSFDAAARYLQAVNRLTEISLSIAPD
jgi:flagellar hook-associated protein 1 FlgK